MNIRIARPFRKMQMAIAILMALVLTSTSLRPSEAQTGPETIWEEGRQVVVGGNDPDAVSIQAVPTTPGSHYRTYSGTAFQPSASTMTFSPIGGAIYVTALPAGGFSLNVEMLLPQGSTITEVVFFFVDNDATNFGFSLRSYNLETDAFMTLESAASSGASTTLRTITITVDPPIVIDNTTTTYRLRVAPGVASSAHLLHGARVGFTIPTTYLPLLER